LYELEESTTKGNPKIFIVFGEEERIRAILGMIITDEYKPCRLYFYLLFIYSLASG
jgi:hypothetical protein